MKRLIFLFVAYAMVACSHYPGDVERALKLAGDNREELEKVLEHYGKRKEDKLKLQSAYFLIANMPSHFAVYDTRLEAFKSYLADKEPQVMSWVHFKENYNGVEEKEIKPDLLHITSEYLIRNIDFSFRVWKETPWCKNYSFDIFCEEILPYRLSNEPLEYWKEEYYATFRPLIDTMTNSHIPEEVAIKLIRHIAKDHRRPGTKSFESHGFGALMLLHKWCGGCKEETELMTYMLRSVGIPSGIDLIIQNPDHTAPKHYWTYARTIDGKCIGVELYGARLIEEMISSKARKYGKIYRQYHGLQKESFPVKYNDRFIPQGGLREVLLRDVTHEYFPDTHISIHLNQSELFGKKDLAFLCIYNGTEWIPVTGCMPKRGVAEFRNVEPGILYQVWLINGVRRVAVSKPFILRGNENAQFPDADTTNCQTMNLLRKYRMPHHPPYYAGRSDGGKFQGANRPDFSDAITLYTIQKEADFNYVDIKLGHPGKFKYVRYLSADGGYNNMAEVKFYSKGNVLYGEVIGTDGAKEEFPNSTKYAVYDDDPLTFFDATDADGAWSGLAMDKAYHIDAIRYIFRNDDNNIRPGDTYELFYQSNGQWLSSGRQIADTLLLRYDNIPSNTLFWLRNHTRGKEERPFTYEAGKQIFW